MLLLLLLLSLAAALLSGPRLGAVGAGVAEGPTPQALGLPPLHCDEEAVPFLGVDQVRDLREGSPRRLHTEGSYPGVCAIFIVEGANLPGGALSALSIHVQCYFSSTETATSTFTQPPRSE